jgi:hypothetical protein
MRRLFIVLLSSALIATACGGSSADKTSSGDGEGILLVALLKLQNAPTTVTVTLRSDPASLKALDASAGQGSLGNEAATILDSSITISHTQASDPSKARSQTIINLGGANAIETRMIDRILYVRVDAAALAKEMGVSDAQLRGMAREAKAKLKFVGPALAGKWLSVAGADKLTGQAGMVLPGSSKQKEARDAFLQRLLGSATVTTVGEDKAGTHMSVSVPAREAYSGLMDLISNMGSGLPPGGAGLPSPTSVPNKNIKMDAWVRDGSLTQLEVDLRQFAALGGHPLPSSVDALALRMTIRDFTGTIEAPSGAVPVNLKQLTKAFSGTTTSEGHASAPAPTSALSQAKCSDLAKLPAAQLKGFASSIPAAQLKMLSHHCPSLKLGA